MQRIVEFGKRFVRQEDGLAVTEYALLLALVAVVVVGIVRTFGTSVKTIFTNANTELTK